MIAVKRPDPARKASFRTVAIDHCGNIEGWPSEGLCRCQLAVIMQFVQPKRSPSTLFAAKIAIAGLGISFKDTRSRLSWLRPESVGMDSREQEFEFVFPENQFCGRFRTHGI
jgi:hypothetical protein